MATESMTKDNTSCLDEIEQNFRRLIIEKCKFCQFNKFLVENPDFEFPKITENCSGHITIPGMFGGFDYFVEKQDDKLVLYAEQSSRMDYSSDDYLYYEVATSGSRLLRDEEREAARKKFWEVAKREHGECKRKIEEAMRKAGEEYGPGEQR